MSPPRMPSYSPGVPTSPSWLPEDRVWVIPPSIDPFSVEEPRRGRGHGARDPGDHRLDWTARPGEPARSCAGTAASGVVRQAAVMSRCLPGPRRPGLSRSPAGTGSRTWPGVMRGAPTCRARRGRVPGARRPGGHRRRATIPRGRGRVRRLPAAVARRCRRGPVADPAGDPSAGRHRRERRDGQRAAAARQPSCAEEPRRGVRADRRGGECGRAVR